MKELKVRLTFMEHCLGTSPADKEVFSTYVAGLAPDAKKKEEEIETLGTEGYEEKQMTVFPRDDDGDPMFWDYQIKGFFKDSCSALQRCKGEEYSKASCALKAYKKIIDGCIFPEPRKIKIDMKGGSIGRLQRPLRGQTAQGERIALAMSETVPEGSEVTLSIRLLSDSHEKAVREWLDYGRFKGIGQWRNSGCGRFLWDEFDESGKVIGGNNMAEA